MSDIVQSKLEDAERLADLYGKGFRKTGFASFDEPEFRPKLIEWLRPHCESGSLWFVADEKGPITLAHYDSDKGEVTLIVTRDDARRRGHASKLFERLLEMFPDLKIRAVTRGGTALAKKYGFKESSRADPVWSREGQTVPDTSSPDDAGA